jgi:hypothetical protein
MKTDAKYYQSPEFSQRFTFHIPSDPDPAENAVYVAAADDLLYFPEDYFQIKSYGKFYVIQPR